MILHLDLDTFFVSVERLLNPELNGKPVICGGLSERSVVSTASYEVRKFGVHSGMSMQTALRLCPQAIVISGDRKNYMHYSQLVTQIIKDNAPLYQQMSIDEFYLDLSGMDKYFDVLEWSHNLRMKIINETGLPISFGLSVNKTVAKIASGKAKPMGELFVPENKVQDFLDPLPVEKIPGVGDSMMPRLKVLGIKTIKDLREFLSLGADINTLTKDGYTPLMYSAIFNTPEAVKFLIDNGADVNYLYDGESTLLMIAACECCYDDQGQIAAELIKSGADINFTRHDGEKALTLAYKAKNFGTVRVLLAAGADISEIL